MAASASQRKIDQVLTGARKELESQLGAVRAELARLTAEEQELTAAIATLEPDRSASPASAGRAGGQSRSGGARRRTRAARSSNGRRRRSARGRSKSTAERVSELRALLAEGPKSRNDLAAALNVSPARVQQLLAQLAGAVTSQPDGDRRAKLWSLVEGGGEPGSSKSTQARRRGGRASAKSGAGKRAATG